MIKKSRRDDIVIEQQINKSRRDDIIIERINEQNQKPRRGDIIKDQENNKSRRDDIIKSYMPGTFSTALARFYRVRIQCLNPDLAD